VKWLIAGVLVLVTGYLALFGAVAIAMRRPPEQFGSFMKHMPPALVWGALPARRMWLGLRAGSLAEGQLAPDFTLASLDKTRHVTLSSHRGDRPVVLVFGSYT
jgi:hypothetical protein